MPGRTKPSDASAGNPVGARVHVRWGLDLLPGQLVERYDSSSGPRAVVRLDVQGPGDAEPQTVTVPASEVYPAEDVADLEPPGTWVPHARYEREVVQALGRVLSQMKWADVTKLQHIPDAEYDYAADTNRGRVVVEVKYSHREELTEKRADQAARQLDRLPAAIKFLVSNANFTDRAIQHLASSQVMPLTWRSPKDDHLLVRAISTALERAGEKENVGTGPPRSRSLPTRLPPQPRRPRPTPKRDIETYYEDGRWKNRPEGGQRPSAVYDTKAEAEAAGRQMAIQRDVEHVIKKKDGTIGARNIYPRSRDSRQTKG